MPAARAMVPLGQRSNVHVEIAPIRGHMNQLYRLLDPFNMLVALLMIIFVSSVVTTLVH